MQILHSSRISRLFLCATSLAGLLLAGCGEDGSPTTSAKVLPVTSKLPAGWIHKENYPVAPGAQADYVDFAPTSDGFTANVVVITTPASGVSTASAMQMEISNVQTDPSVTGFAVDSNSVVLVGGVAGHRGQFRFTQVKEGRSFQILSRELLVVAGGKDIQIVLTRLQGDSAAASAFREIEASIRLTGVSP